MPNNGYHESMHACVTAAKHSAPTDRQGIKLELFIFDTFAWAERVALLEVKREEEFAPVKNAPGADSDSPDTARRAILSLHTRSGL